MVNSAKLSDNYIARSNGPCSGVFSRVGRLQDYEYFETGVRRIYLRNQRRHSSKFCINTWPD